MRVLNSLLLIPVFLGAGLVSCGSDDDPTQPPPATGGAAGAGAGKGGSSGTGTGGAQSGGLGGAASGGQNGTTGGKNGTGGTGTGGSSTGGSGMGGSATGGRGGAAGGGSGGNGGGGGTAPSGIFGVPNLDDDNKNGTPDWKDDLFAQDNDVSTWSLPAEVRAALKAQGGSVELTLSGDTSEIRFYRDAKAVLGQGPSGVITTHTVDAAAAEAQFKVEFAQFLRKGKLRVRHLDAGGKELSASEILVMSSPLMMNHHLQPAERVWAVSASTNTQMIQEFQKTLGDKFTTVSNSDVWVQDELEWATATGDGGLRFNIAMDSIRNRELDAWVKGLKAPDIEPITWGQAGTAKTQDKFGNFEVTPPHTAGGVNYPLGRIYYGDYNSEGPNSVIKALLDQQAIQKPIRVDTHFLCVGHVDEFISFIPDAKSPKGFKLLIADTNAALAALRKVNASTALPRYKDSHNRATVGDILNDSALIALNGDVQKDYIDPVRAMLMKELELAESDLVRIPAVWEQVKSCPYGSGAVKVAALTPGMLNLVVVNIPNQPMHIFVSDPFLRSNIDSQAGDPFIEAFGSLIPAGYTVHHVDDWYTYHVKTGEVHCGSNVSRTPSANWWQVGLHLLGVK